MPTVHLDSRIKMRAQCSGKGWKFGRPLAGRGPHCANLWC